MNVLTVYHFIMIIIRLFKPIDKIVIMMKVDGAKVLKLKIQHKRPFIQVNNAFKYKMPKNIFIFS